MFECMIFYIFIQSFILLYQLLHAVFSLRNLNCAKGAKEKIKDLKVFFNLKDKTNISFDLFTFKTIC